MNIIDVFNIIGGPIYQWDINRKLKINLSEEITADEVHFAHDNDMEALVLRIQTENNELLVDIPNILLQSSKVIKVWLVNENQTICGTRIFVTQRAKPSDYVYTETEVLRYETLEKRIEALEKGGGAVNGVQLDPELKDNTKAAPAGLVGELKGDLVDKLDKPEKAPAVGKILKVTAVNEDGSFVCEWADDGGGNVKDVQIDGTSIVGEDGKANIPLGNTNVLGVAKFNPSFGFRMNNNGIVSVEKASNVQIENRETSFGRPINTVNLDYAVKAAMTDGKGEAWTADEQAMARARMGAVGDWELLVDVTTEEDASAFKYTFKDVNEIICMISAIATSKRVNFYSAGMTNFYHYNFLDVDKLLSNYIHIHKRIGGMRYVETGSSTSETPDSGKPYTLIDGAVSKGILVKSTNDIINDLMFTINTTDMLQSGARIQIFGR